MMGPRFNPRPGSTARAAQDGHAISPARRRRFAFLEEELFWKGEVGREVLSSAFDLTPNHVTDDLATYKAACPSNLLYDERRRRYRPGPRFRPQFTAADPRRYLAELRAQADGHFPMAGGVAGVEIVPDPAGAIDATLLQTFTRAIHSQGGLKISYQSLSTAEPTRRTVFPHALAHNGRRWFVRAYDTLRSDFRDFVLSRVLGVASANGSAPLEADDNWLSTLRLIVRPNPRLHEFQRDIVAKEYGMCRADDGWIWEIDLRRAMVVYFLDVHRLRPQAYAEWPDRAPIILENYDIAAPVDWSTAGLTGAF